MWIILYLDEDSQRKVLVQALRQHGIDVLTSSEANQNSKSDADQLAFAASRGRTVFTYNVGDFIVLHTEYINEGKNHAGIIIGDQGRFGIGEEIRRILRIIEAKSAEEMRNNIEYLSNW